MGVFVFFEADLAEVKFGARFTFISGSNYGEGSTPVASKFVSRSGVLDFCSNDAEVNIFISFFGSFVENFVGEFDESGILPSFFGGLDDNFFVISGVFKVFCDLSGGFVIFFEFVIFEPFSDVSFFLGFFDGFELEGGFFFGDTFLAEIHVGKVQTFVSGSNDGVGFTVVTEDVSVD